MSRARVYVPGSLGLLRDVVRAGGLGPLPVLGHAVTEALRREYPDAGQEEWEYVAMAAAAHDSLGVQESDDPPRRVVIVIEDAAARPVADEVTLVELTEVAPARTIVAVHVDTPDAEADVMEARSMWDAAQEGEPGAVAVVDRCADHELAWFATQEISDLLRMVE